jgi:5-methylcytosine-specific restriction endonuclease McrA
MGKKTPPHPEYPEWTEARFNQFIRSALRAAWSRWPPKYQCLNEGRKTVKGKKHKYEYQCTKCAGWFKAKDVQVDHVVPAGTSKDSWDTFIKKLFVGTEKLQRLCKPCHLQKTRNERERKTHEDKAE